MRLKPSGRLQTDLSLILLGAVLLVVLLSAASIFPARALAQDEAPGAIVGQVTDKTGNGIPGATVTVTEQATGMKDSAKTDAAGLYSFSLPKPGIYSVKVEAQGFRSQQQGDNNVSGPAQKQTVNFTLNDGFW